MADGLDVLLGTAAGPQSAPNGLDVLMGASAPARAVAPVSTVGVASNGGIGSSIGQGLKDSLSGPAQLLYNALPQGVRNAGDAVDNWLYAKTGGAIGTAPGGFNAAVASENRQYEADRAAAGRDGFDVARTVGNVVGSLPVAVLSGGSSAPATLAAALGRGAVSGAATGAMSPVTDDSAGFWNQKAAQTATGAAAGVGGAGLARALGAIASPVIGKSQQALVDAGITLTPGQLLGGALKSAEEKLASVPVLGSFIKSAQNRTTEDLNRAAYARVLQPLNDAGISVQMPAEVGRAGVDAVTRQVQNAYNNEVLPRLTLRADPQLGQDLSRLLGMAQQGLEPAQLQRFMSVVQAKLAPLSQTGTAYGKTLQGMMSDIGNMATGYRSDASFANRQLGDALASVEQALKGAVSRTDPQQAALLSKVDEAFANLVRVQTAAAGLGAGNGVFSAAQLSAAVKAGDKTARDKAYGSGHALMQDLSDPAKEVLGATVPNSGTADRGMLAYLLAGAAGGAQIHPGVAAAAGAAALPYTQTGQRAIQAAILNRPQSARALADLLRRYSVPIGAAAAPALVSGAQAAQSQ